jgi:hypothetical protein
MRLKIIFFIAYIAALSGINAAQTIYLLKVKPPRATSEPWCGIYGGRPLSFSGDMAIIKDTKMSLVFSLLITNDITYCQAGCTVRCLSRRPGASVRWFDLSLKLVQGVWKWDVIELSAHQIPLIIPYHTIIFFFDPELIEGLKSPAIACCSPTNAHRDTGMVFEFPAIVIKNIPFQKVEAACQEAHLSYLDVRGILAQATSVERIIDCVVLKQTTTSDV